MSVSLDRYDVKLTQVGYEIRIDHQVQRLARSRAAACEAIEAECEVPVALIPVAADRWIVSVKP